MNRIAEVLKEKGIKQTWLADKIGKSYNMTNSYIRNRRQPSIKVLFKIGEALKVKPHMLIKGSEAVKKNDIHDDLRQSEQLVCDICGSTDVIEAPHMGRNCNQCNPL